ncbi:tyrosine-protein phosphatase non-receptor type 4 isoform X1 [Tachysurus ichikawai]
MSSRFRLPAGRSYNVRASELARDRQHTEVLCNVVLLDNTIQPFKVNVSKGRSLPKRFTCHFKNTDIIPGVFF